MNSECLRKLFVELFEKIYLNSFYNQKGLDSDKADLIDNNEILEIQKEYLARLDELLQICILLEPTNEKVQTFISRIKDRR
jgi:hypothetical protein